MLSFKCYSDTYYLDTYKYSLYLSLNFVNSPVFINSEVCCIWRQVTVENYFWQTDPNLRSADSCNIDWGMDPVKKSCTKKCCFVLQWFFGMPVFFHFSSRRILLYIHYSFIIVQKIREGKQFHSCIENSVTI